MDSNTRLSKKDFEAVGVDRRNRKPVKVLSLDMIKPDAKGAAVARYIFPYFQKCGLSNSELAKKVSYTNHSNMSMVRTGQARLPLVKAPLMADALGIENKSEFGLLVAENNLPESVAALRELGVIASDKELELLVAIRKRVLPSELGEFKVWLEEMLEVY